MNKPIQPGCPCWYWKGSQEKWVAGTFQAWSIHGHDSVKPVAVVLDEKSRRTVIVHVHGGLSFATIPGAPPSD